MRLITRGLSIALFSLGILAGVHDSLADPSDASWGSEALVVTLERGGTVDVTSTLSANRATGPLTLTASPLSQLITITPKTLPAMSAGQSVLVRFTFTTPPGPASSLKAFKGLVNVSSGSALVAPSLPYNVNVTRSGDLIGKDIDGNGVWDYIDLYINNTILDPIEKKAARQFAVAVEKVLVSSLDVEGAQNAASLISLGVDCYYFVRGENASAAINQLKAAILNTKARSLAYIRAGDLVAGGTITTSFDNSTACTR